MEVDSICMEDDMDMYNKTVECEQGGWRIWEDVRGYARRGEELGVTSNVTLAEQLTQISTINTNCEETPFYYFFFFHRYIFSAYISNFSNYTNFNFSLIF